MNNRKLSFALALILSLSAISCGSGGDVIGGETTTSEDGETTPEVTAPAEINRENAVIGLPELDFKGETINILYAGEKTYAQDVTAEETGDVVDDAVVARNRSVEELLKVKLNPIVFSDNTKETAEHLAKVILAGEDLYDLASVHQSYSKTYVSEGYYHNFANDQYIDFDKPWWNNEYMEEMVVGSERKFFLIGDISLMYLKSLGCIYYNKELYESIYKNPDEPYDLVFDGKWTFEKFDELTRGAYSDLNGDGTVDKADQFGAFGSKNKSVEHFVYGAGIRSTTKNKDGIPELTLYNEKTVSFAELLHKLYYENQGFLIAPNNQFTEELPMFQNGQVLFAPTWLRYADTFRDMKTDYGIVCMPKFLESDEYSTLVHDGTTVFVAPTTSKKTDMIGAVCEAFAFYNYKSVTPAYYEVALKVKYSRDDATAQMLDLIHSSAFTNFGYVYASQLDGLTSVREFVVNGAEDFASWYKSKESAALAGLAEVIETYKGIDG